MSTVGLPSRGGATVSVAMGAVLYACVVAGPLSAQERCAGKAHARADWGIRYRFVSGQFFDHPDGGQWIHFLTEPVVVSVSPDGPAAGRLRSGDVVASVDGRLITTLEGSRRFAFGTEAPIRLDVRRSGESVEVAVSPEITCEGTAPSRITRGRSGRSGFRLRCRECGLEGGRWRFSSPPIVTAVLPGSPAARAGLSIGDVLVAVDGAALTTDTGAERFSALSAGERVVWTVRRGGEELRLTWTIGEGGTER